MYTVKAECIVMLMIGMSILAFSTPIFISAIKDLCEYGFEDTAMMALVTSIPLLVIGIATTLFGLGIITIV